MEKTYFLWDWTDDTIKMFHGGEDKVVNFVEKFPNCIYFEAKIEVV